ncbi:43721_t:CDS:2, partial [Gigaspora margarita]
RVLNFKERAVLGQIISVRSLPIYDPEESSANYVDDVGTIFSINRAPFLWIGFVKSLQATCFDVMKGCIAWNNSEERFVTCLAAEVSQRTCKPEQFLQITFLKKESVPFLWIGFVKSLQATCFDVMKGCITWNNSEERFATCLAAEVVTKNMQSRAVSSNDVSEKGIEKKTENINHERNISNSETSYTCKVNSGKEIIGDGIEFDLTRIATHSDFLHLLIFGAGKKTHILCILNELFGDGAEKADEIMRDAQAALQRTVEKYMLNLRIILCCNSMSRIIEPIRSRCMLIIVSLPSIDEISTTLQLIESNECISLADKINLQSQKNPRKAILTFEKKVDEIPKIDQERVID